MSYLKRVFPLLLIFFYSAFSYSAITSAQTQDTFTKQMHFDNNFDPIPPKNGLDFCNRATHEKMRTCMPIFVFNSQDALEVNIVFGIHAGKVLIHNNVGVLFFSRHFLISEFTKVVNPNTHKVLFWGFLHNKQGIICNDTQCRRWK
ncbi:hypothetical protein D5018_11215 [Parashewanella curva]|uniref:Uncharacterized protein n=1 Tax=Parashewanella curva TaxID=2338552 RepID=A0A3L8PWE6_9GAMM|nr:hypothetical protein [Parashewanella curva]RLV59611.1 hypothetical protein D5018_11215 [Parashewanella curva]